MSGATLGQLLEGSNESLDPYSERILDAAHQQLVEFGLRRTSLDDIAEAAGVGRATLFRRFANRDALVLALAAREARVAIAAIDAKVGAIEDPREFLVASALAVIHALAKDDLIQRLLRSDTDRMLPLLAGPGSQILLIGRDYLAGQLRRLRALGARIIGDIDVIAELLARVTVSLVVNPESVMPLDDDVQLEQVIRTTVVPLVLGTNTQEGRT